MAALGSQSIASSYEQLLQVDRDGGGNGTTHVNVKDGDNGTTFGFTIASDALMMSSTNRLEFGDTGTYIHQSADGVLDLVSDTEIEINATTIDINGALDVSGNITMADDTSIGISDSDERIEFDGAGDISVLGANFGINTDSPASVSTGISNFAPKLDIRGGTGTGVATAGAMILSTAETTIADGDYLGMIAFQAPVEGSGSDAILSPASIHAEAEVAFDGSSNSTSIVFSTADSSTPIERMRIHGEGNVGFGQTTPQSDLSSNNFIHIGSSSTSANGVVIEDDENQWELHSNGAFTICDGNTARVTINGSNGAVTMGSQPAFCARATSTTNMSVGSNVDLVFGTERFDQGSNFAADAGNGNRGTFTAPVTGKYQFNFYGRFDEVDSAATYYQLKLITSNYDYNNVNIFDPDFGQDAAYWTMQFSVVADMDANDTAYITFFQSGGSAQTDIDSASVFSGFLAC